MKLTAGVGEIGLLSSLAVSRRRLMVATGVAHAAALVWGVVVADFVETSSRDVGVNLLLISGHFLLMLVAGWISAMLLGAVIFGDVWRERTLLGLTSSVESDDDETASLASRDHSIPFYTLFALAFVAAVALSSVATGNYITTYGDRGYFRTLMRSDDASVRIRAVRNLVDPLNRSAASDPILMTDLAGLVSDPDADVRSWAAWAAGHRMVIEARPALLVLLEKGTPSERAEAALALGRLGDPIGQRRMTAMLASSVGESEVTGALLRGLGLTPTPEAMPQIAALLGLLPPDLEAAAMWTIGRSRTTCTREQVLKRWASDDPATRCAAAEALKHVSTVEDNGAMRRAFFETPRDVVCAEVTWEGRRYMDDERMEPIRHIIGESLRMKYLIASYNIAGPGLQDWMQAIFEDAGEDVAIRLRAEELLTTLRSGVPREPRTWSPCVSTSQVGGKP